MHRTSARSTPRPARSAPSPPGVQLHGTTLTNRFRKVRG